MKSIIDAGVLLLTILLMAIVGMGLEKRHFIEVVRRKGMVVSILAIQVVLLPTLGLVMTRIMALPQRMSAGILLLAACPIGDISNLYTMLGRANVALSVTMNALSCLLSVVTMPVIFVAYDALMRDHFPFAVPPLALAVKMFLMVLLPVLTGMLIRRVRPDFVEQHGKALQAVVIAGIILLVMYVLLSQREQLAEGWLQMAIACAAFMGMAMLLGLAVGRALKLTVSDTVTVAIVFSVRNVALALAIAVTLLGRVEYAAFAVVYFLTEVSLLFAMVVLYRRLQGRNTLHS